MKNRAVLVTALLLAAASAVVAWRLGAFSTARTSGPLRHEVYIWQRAWTKPVHDAVAQHGTNFARLVPLRAEISWKDRKPQLTRVAVDYRTLNNVAGTDPDVRPGPGVGLALRIGPYAGPFATNDPIVTFITDVADLIVSDARTNGVPLTELQIDFDAAQSKLDGYRLWVEAIRQRVAPLPVTITALPSWLNSPAFKRLAVVAPNYVLQVHSVERPRRFDAPFSLCEPRAARRAVERAARIGVPFRVALPTYGYTLAFDPAEKFLGLSAEGPRPNWPTNALLREVASDPVELSALVQSWTTDRPAAMRGIIWYRLPTIVDNFNWRWPTLGAIVASRSLQEKLRIEPRRVEAGLTEVILVNEGELDISSRLAVEVRWTDARLIASDALRDFELADRRTSAARFQTQSQPDRKSVV